MSSPDDEGLLASALDLDARRDLEEASERLFRDRNAEGIPAISKMRQAWTPAEFDQLKASSQHRLDSLYDLADPRMFPAGDTLNLGEWLSFRKALDKDPHFSKTKQPARPAGRPKVQPGTVVTGVLGSSDMVLSLNPFAVTEDTEVKGVLASNDAVVKGVDRTRYTGDVEDAYPQDDFDDNEVVGTSTLRVQKRKAPRESKVLPSIPQRATTQADAVSLLTLLTSPNFPKDPKAIEEILFKVTEYDPMAQAALKRGAVAVPLATAQKAKAVVNDEWGIDLTYKGYDYSLPVSNKRVPPLDPARQYLVDALTSLAVASVRNDRYQQDGLFDMTSPFGVNLMNRSARSNPGAISRFLGALNSNLALRGNTVDPVDAFLKVAFPGMDDSDKHPVQTFFGESIRFFGDWALPGQNVKDVMGGRIMPFGVKSAEHRFTANLREAFGAPKVGTIYMPDGSSGFVSLLPAKFRTDIPGYARGLYGYNTEGDEISGWSAIREAALAGYMDKASNPRLDEASSVTKQKAVAGRYWDVYAQEWRTLEEEFIVGKKGETAKRISVVDIDHVLSLAWLHGHGFGKWIERYLASDGTDPKLNAMWDLAASYGTGGGPVDAQGRPLQLVPTYGPTNKFKSSKGPGEWLPFPMAHNDQQHRANEWYVSALLTLIAHGKSEQQRIIGAADRGFLNLSRTDRIQIERVTRGYDRVPDNIYGRTKSKATDLYLETMVEPDLLAQSLHRQINQFGIYSVANLSWTTATWKYVPANQLYLMAREHFVSGLWGPFWSWVDEHAEAQATRQAGGTPRDPRTLRKHISVFWDNRYGDVLQRKVPSHDMALKVARMVSLQGSVERIYSSSGDDAVQILQNRHRVVAPSWSQGIAYGFGKDAPFGAPKVKPELWQVVKRPEFIDEVNRTLRGFVDNPRPAAFKTEASRSQVRFLRKVGRGALTNLVNEIRSTLDAGDDAPAELSRFHKRVLRAARSDVLSGYETVVTTVRGRGALAPSPFIKDIYSIVVSQNSWATKGRKALVTTSGEGIVKTTDYGLKALARGDAFFAGGIGRNFSNLPAITGVETVASLMATQIGATQHVPAHIGRWRWSESRFKPLGFLDWVEKQQSTYRSDIRFSEHRAKRLSSIASTLRLRANQYARDDLFLRMSRMQVLGPELRLLAPGGLAASEAQFDKMANQAIRYGERAKLAQHTADYNRNLLAQFQETMPKKILDDARAPRTLRRLINDFAYSNPRVPLVVGRAAHVPAGMVESFIAPGRAYASAARFLNSKPVSALGRGTGTTLKVGGAALQGFGFLESGMRYSLASRQADLGWEFMDDEQRAGVDAYIHPGRFDRALDVGLVFTPLHAYTGALLAAGNDAGIRAVRSKMVRDTGYVSDYHSRLLQSRPLVSDEYRRAAAKANARKLGLLLYDGNEAERDQAFREDSAYAELQISQKRKTFESLGDHKRLKKLEELERKLRGYGPRPAQRGADTAFVKNKRPFPVAPSEITQQSVLIRNQIIATEEEKRGRAQNKAMEEYFGLFAPADSMESSKRRRLMGLEAARIVERDRMNASKQAAHELRTKFSWKALSQLLDAANPGTTAVGFIPYDSAVIKQDRMRADSLSKIPARPRRPK